MFDFIKKFFGISPESETQIIKSGKSTIDSYFSTMGQFEEAMKNRDYNTASTLVRQNIRMIPGLVREWKSKYEDFDIGIPCLQQGGTILALLGDEEGLNEMKQIVDSIDDLKPWSEEVEKHIQDRQLFKKILIAVKNHPNCLQSEIKKLIGEKDGHRIANLISYLEKAGKIVRIKEKRNYKLILPEVAEFPSKKPKRNVVSHRKGRKPPKLNEIDIASLEYIPLPRSPQQWDDNNAKKAKSEIRDASAIFEIQDADWEIASVNKIPMNERPDPAFRKMYPTDSGLLMIDDLGNADDLGQIDSAALRYDRDGDLVVKTGLDHGIYRIEVHPLGSGLIAMSKECVVHAYDKDIKLLFETQITDAPEIKKKIKHCGIQQSETKNHIRCVAMSRDTSRYLYTIVDEAWCIDSNGNGLWGAKFPLKEGWDQIVTPSESFGTQEEVSSALNLMGLTFPITPGDVKQSYRRLAKQWHPDLNPNDAEAEEKMKQLTSACQLLTGIDESSLAEYVGVKYEQRIAHSEIDVGGATISISTVISGGETLAADWIYAAGFAANSDSVYLAAYSGRIVLVDENGEGVRCYDIGAVPRKIVDTGDYLYILTGTRLYLLKENKFYGLVDTFGGGDLIVAQTGFGLLEKKRLRWFNEDGTYLGSIISKAPIRRIYSIDNNMVIESRQHRTIIKGAPSLWEE
jgi:DnaJ-like protein